MSAPKKTQRTLFKVFQPQQKRQRLARKKKSIYSFGVPLTKKSPKLMMSVFRSNSLIHAPECGKCILRDLNFQNFPGEHAPRPPLEASALRRSLKTPSASFSISPPTSQILPSTPFLIENPDQWTYMRRHCDVCKRDIFSAICGVVRSWWLVLQKIQTFHFFFPFFFLSQWITHQSS